MKDNSKELKIIRGDMLLDPKEAGGEFLHAYATNTRLMGVVGVHIHRKADYGFFHQLFYLDMEEYGLDDYESFKISHGASTEELIVAEKKLFGGLGGHSVPINEKEAIFLICQTSTLNMKNDLPLPDGIEEYGPILDSPVKLDDDEYSSLMGKICEAPAGDLGLINYYIMRATGMDAEAVKYLSAPDGAFDVIKLREPATLHRNEIDNPDTASETTKSIKEFLSTSLIEDENGYRLIRSSTETLGSKVVSFTIISDMEVTQWEAANILRKDEFISYFRVSSKVGESISRWMEKNYPDATIHIHTGGSLYMIYHPTNNHVNRRIYRLDNDVRVSVYVKHNGEILITGPQPTAVEVMEEKLITSFGLSTETMADKARYIFPEPTLGLFILGDEEIYHSFLDFLQIFTTREKE